MICLVITICILAVVLFFRNIASAMPEPVCEYEDDCHVGAMRQDNDLK